MYVMLLMSNTALMRMGGNVNYKVQLAIKLLLKSLCFLFTLNANVILVAVGVITYPRICDFSKELISWQHYSAPFNSFE